MKNDVEELKIKFNKIKNMDWIESKRNGSTGIGYTFEYLIGKNEDQKQIPDYKSIEIKTKHKYSKGYITLFNLNPDGNFNAESFVNKYGYKDKDIKKNVFRGSLNFITSDFMGINYKFQLSIDNSKERLIINIRDKYNKLINNEIYWSFEKIQEALNKKLKFLAIVKADRKYINKIEYFKYEKINFFKLKDFKDFIKAIELGYIRVTIKIGVFKSGKRYGQIHNHGIGFDINEKDILHIYNRLY